jgi:hypothetical protein
MLKRPCASGPEGLEHIIYSILFCLCCQGHYLFWRARAHLILHRMPIVWHELKIWHGRHAHHPQLRSLVLAQQHACLNGYFSPSLFTWKQMGGVTKTLQTISASENGQCPEIIPIWYQTTVTNPQNYITNVISTGISGDSLSFCDYIQKGSKSQTTPHVMGSAIPFLRSNADRCKKPITQISV